jgi:hypothetical protein
MGTLLDLNKNHSHDYVDNPFWSVFQIRTKFLLHSHFLNRHLPQLVSAEQKRLRFLEEEEILKQELKNNEEDPSEYYKREFENKGVRLGLTDLGKVTLFVNLTMNESMR